MTRRGYPSDLTDEQWTWLQGLIPKPKSGGPKGGRPPADRREIINGIFYVLRSGCQWRMLPADFPPWQTVYHYHRLWRIDGTWRQIHAMLRELTRDAAGRELVPSVAVIDSQSVKTTEKGALVATTLAKRSMGASGTSRSTPSACC